MAVVAIAHNGIGLGHVSRLIALCERLASAGQKPILFAEGSSYSVIPHDFPSASISKMYDQSTQVRSEIGRAISALALLSFPSVVVEDTHPLALKFSKNVSRVLVVRPIEWPGLEKLKASDEFHAVLIADHPASPTWPYSDSQTKEITSWHSWFCVGPLYRRSSNLEIDDVKRRYRLTKRSRLCVFSMGGGGEHFGANDAALFCKRARSIGNWLLTRDPSVRLVFVGGPLFQRYDLIPQFFTTAKSEPFMPALFALADAAVIRPGFNSVWECIAGGTPIIPILGTSYIEPMAVREARLQSFGIAFRHIGDCWNDDARIRVKAAARLAAKRWTGQVALRMVRKILAKNGHLGSDSAAQGPKFLRGAFFRSLMEEEPWEIDLQRLKEVLRFKSVSVRIDDVTDLMKPTKSLVELCGEFGLGVSLEMVPYFTQISRTALLRCKIEKDLVEVSQHGYSHILRSCRPQPKSEFTFSEVAVEREMDEIAKGKLILEKKFPKEFRKGFSPPFDGMPSWLGECWAQLGGAYFSVIEARPIGTRMPYVINSVDVWNWAISKPHSLSHIRNEIISAIARSGHAGLILHPRHFLTAGSSGWLRKLLNWLDRGNVEFVLPSTCARFQSWAVVTSPYRRYASLAPS